MFIGHSKNLFSGPQGLHFIRQTDSLAFVYHYFFYDWSFFQPGVLNLESEEAKAACEFPLYYYFTALSFSLLGVKMYLLKWLYAGTLYLGLFHTLKLAEVILKSHWFALLFLLPILTSTVFHNYSFNYLPDAPALGLTLSGIYFLNKFGIDLYNKKGWVAISLFTLAGLIKITFFIYPVAFVCLSITTYISKVENHFFRLPPKRTILGFGLSAVVILLWNFYLYDYNAQFHSDYFLGSAKPYWTIISWQREEIWSHIVHYWYVAYFAHSSYHLFIAVILISLLLVRKLNTELWILNLFFFLGAFCYMLLFFEQFMYHDYYMLVMVPFFIFLSLPLLTWIVQTQKSIQIGVVLVFLAIGLPGINYSRMKLIERRALKVDLFSEMYASITASKSKIQAIIGEQPIVIVGDASKNGSLLALERKGWQVPIDQSLEDWSAANAIHPTYVLYKKGLYKGTEQPIFQNQKLQLFQLND